MGASAGLDGCIWWQIVVVCAEKYKNVWLIRKESLSLPHEYDDQDHHGQE